MLISTQTHTNTCIIWIASKPFNFLAECIQINWYVWFVTELIVFNWKSVNWYITCYHDLVKEKFQISLCFHALSYDLFKCYISYNVDHKLFSFWCNNFYFLYSLYEEKCSHWSTVHRFTRLINQHIFSLLLHCVSNNINDLFHFRIEKRTKHIVLHASTQFNGISFLVDVIHAFGFSSFYKNISSFK